jgi:ATP/maltotriose-dependent transcriptional regulator MalT
MHRYRQVQLQAWAGLEAGIPALAEGRWPEAADRIGQALETTRRGGYLAYEPHFLAHLAWLERAQGRYAEALRHGQRAVDLATGTAHPWFMAMAGAMHGWTLTELGVLDQAVVWLERGLAAAERDATEGYLVRCLGHLAWACVRRGEPERAGELAGRTAELLAGVTGGVFQYGGHAALAAAEAQLERGDPAAAQRLLAPIGRAAAESGWVETQAWADLLRARCQWALGDRDRAAGLAGTALATADRVGLAGIAWQAHAVLAGLAGGAGGTDAGGAGAARRHLVAGRAILDRLAGDLVDPPTRDAYQASSRARWHALATASAPGG